MSQTKIPPAYLKYSHKDRLISPNRGGRAWMINATNAPKTGSVYLPRVWWDKKTLMDATRGPAHLNKFTPMYGVNVRELSANSLYDWLLVYGHLFGWKIINPSDKMQQAQALANASPPGMLWGVADYLDVENSLRYKPKSGKTYCNVYCCDLCYLTSYAVIIVGWNRLGPGHICAVMPETNEIKARADHPVISEAGGINHKATNNSYWWKIKNSRTDFDENIVVWFNKGEANEKN